MITTISFDLDQTLWDFHASMRRALGIVLAHLRSARPCEATQGLTVERMVAIRDQVAAELRGRETNLERIRLAAFTRTLEHIRLPDATLAAELNALYFEHRFRGELFPDVLPTLQALRRTHRVGVLSNGNSYPERVGLEGQLDFVVLAQDHGVEKPDVRLFRITEQAAGARPEQIVHVGDSLASDVAGAAAAGWKAVYLNRAGAPPCSDAVPHAEIRSLHALPELVSALS